MRDFWVIKEGLLLVVKVLEGVNFALLEVLNTFVATTFRSNNYVKEVEDWFRQVMRVAVEVKRLNKILFWVKLVSDVELQRVLFASSNLCGSPL